MGSWFMEGIDSMVYSLRLCPLTMADVTRSMMGPAILETTNLATAHAAAGHCWIGDVAMCFHPGTS